MDIQNSESKRRLAEGLNICPFADLDFTRRGYVVGHFRDPHQDLLRLFEADDKGMEERDEEPPVGIGPDGWRLMDLLKEYKPERYQSFLQSEDVRLRFRKRMEWYNETLLEGMRANGINEPLAKEQIWPDLCAEYGIW